MASKDPQKAGAVYGHCPICAAPTEMAFRPFCSARCRDVDLSRWLRGGYAIPGGRSETEEDGKVRAATQAAADDAEEDEENCK